MFSLLNSWNTWEPLKNRTFNSLHRHFLHVFDVHFHALIEAWNCELSGGNWAGAWALPYQSILSNTIKYPWNNEIRWAGAPSRQLVKRLVTVSWHGQWRESLASLALPENADAFGKLRRFCTRWGLRRRPRRPILIILRQDWRRPTLFQKKQCTGRRPSPRVRGALQPPLSIPFDPFRSLSPTTFARTNRESETYRESETKNQKLKAANQKLKSANQKPKSRESETKNPANQKLKCANQKQNSANQKLRIRN